MSLDGETNWYTYSQDIFFLKIDTEVLYISNILVDYQKKLIRAAKTRCWGKAVPGSGTVMNNLTLREEESVLFFAKR
jgi:hypothetical protein